MSIFSGANQAQMMSKGSQARITDFPGTHVLKVKLLKQDISKKTRNAYAAGDFEVARSSNGALAAGAPVGWVAVKNPTWPDYFFTDVKKLIGALLGRKPEEIPDATLDQAFGDTQPARDRYVGVKVGALAPGQKFADYEFFTAGADYDVGPVSAPLPVAANSDRPAPRPAAAGAGDNLFS